MPAERMALGTVQFGLPYGLANATGQIAPGAIASILAAARDAGVDTIDTAIAYGEAEARLGEAGVSAFRVVSKLPPIPEGLTEAAGVEQWVRAHVSESLTRLRIPRLHALLLHRAADLVGPAGNALAASMIKMKEAGFASGIGVSVYSPDDLDAVEARLPCTLVQLPCSVIDQRFVRSGCIRRLHATGVEVHARSIFLQGLLLMPADRRPPFFERWASLWQSWDAWRAHSGQSALQGCLAFALAVPGVSRIVVGIDEVDQLREIVSAASGPLPPPPDIFHSDDRSLVEPSRWPALEPHGS